MLSFPSFPCLRQQEEEAAGHSRPLSSLSFCPFYFQEENIFKLTVITFLALEFSLPVDLCAIILSLGGGWEEASSCSLHIHHLLYGDSFSTAIHCAGHRQNVDKRVINLKVNKNLTTGNKLIFLCLLRKLKYISVKCSESHQF